MASERPAAEASFRLWTGNAPGNLGMEEHDIPTLTPYWPPEDIATGAAIVVCPGGGYGGLAPHEGDHYARWLNAQGIAAFVLKYRLGSNGYRHPCMLQDAARALRTVRAYADTWQLDARRIGIMGSSAGGHLASTLMTHFDGGDTSATDPIEQVSSRPDLGILCYAVISMGEEIGHAGCRKNLLGKEPSPALIRLLSNETQVTPDTPPGFLWHTVEDGGVKVENSAQFAMALRQFDIPFELHLYEKGHHGLGLGSNKYDPNQWLPWTYECARWLKEQGFGEGLPAVGART